MPLAYKEATADCDIPAMISPFFPYYANYSIDAYFQIYDNICEVFDIERSSTYYLDDLFTVQITPVDLTFTDIDLSLYHYLSYVDINIGSDTDW